MYSVVLLIGAFLRHRHILGLAVSFVLFPQPLTAFVAPVGPRVAVPSGVQLARVQMSSCLCVRSICLAPLGAFKMFRVN